LKAIINKQFKKKKHRYPYCLPKGIIQTTTYRVAYGYYNVGMWETSKFFIKELIDLLNIYNWYNILAPFLWRGVYHMRTNVLTGTDLFMVADLENFNVVFKYTYKEKIYRQNFDLPLDLYASPVVPIEGWLKKSTDIDLLVSFHNNYLKLTKIEFDFI
jgi:hypothetical protein